MPQPFIVQFSLTSPSSALLSSSLLLLTSPPWILPCPQPIDEGDCIFLCCKIGAASFVFLIKKAKSDGTVHLFAKSMREIDNEIALAQETDTLGLSTMNEAEAKAAERELLNRLLPEYHKFKDVFDQSEANKLPPHRPMDYKIELTSKGVTPLQSRAYKMSPYKLVKIKEYLTDMLGKGFIMLSKAAYSSPILFAVKANGDLQFCVNYQKLNAITKQNHYSLPLIKKVIEKLHSCKHFIWINIITAFNTIWMHPDSKDLIMFTITMGQYKYCVLPFGLTNGPSTFQQYINEVLWEFLDDFCQVYIDDILIYNRTKMEH